MKKLLAILLFIPIIAFGQYRPPDRTNQALTGAGYGYRGHMGNIISQQSQYDPYTDPNVFVYYDYTKTSSIIKSGTNLIVWRPVIGDTYNSEYLINGGSSETTDWVDGNSDGLADSWGTATGCSYFIRSVLGNRYQTIKRTSTTGNARITYANPPPDSLYKVNIRYVATRSFTCFGVTMPIKSSFYDTTFYTKVAIGWITGASFTTTDSICIDMVSLKKSNFALSPETAGNYPLIYDTGVYITSGTQLSNFCSITPFPATIYVFENQNGYYKDGANIFYGWDTYLIYNFALEGWFSGGNSFLPADTNTRIKSLIVVRPESYKSSYYVNGSLFFASDVAEFSTTLDLKIPGTVSNSQKWTCKYILIRNGEDDAETRLRIYQYLNSLP